MPTDDKKKQEDDQLKQGELLGMEGLDPFTQKLFKKYPDLAKAAISKEQRNTKLFEAISKQIDFFMDLEARRKKLVGDDLYTPDPRVAQMIEQLTNQQLDLMQGVSQQEIEQLKSPQDISVGNNFKLSQAEFNELSLDPSRAQNTINQLHENGLTDEANTLSDMLSNAMADQAQNEAQGIIGNVQPRVTSPLSEPTPVEPVDNPEAVGGSNPIDNIKNNIKRFLGSPQEQVNNISDSLRSTVNKRGVGN